MAFSSSCFCHFSISHKLQRNQTAPFTHGSNSSVLSRQQYFLRGSRVITSPNLPKTLLQRRSSRVSVSYFHVEVSRSKSLASENKGFAFWVEFVTPGLPSAGYLSYVVCELLHRSGSFTLCAPKG
ncbi:hypothetical protein AABB24_025729 [Solanum stoloniferum]|uniref:Uncharacterized protein n=1 Tax=Solanum stoloniferum TaxID=62892 RepID=A0ABD2SC64_9SOLN